MPDWGLRVFANGSRLAGSIAIAPLLALASPPAAQTATPPPSASADPLQSTISEYQAAVAAREWQRARKLLPGLMVECAKRVAREQCASLQKAMDALDKVIAMEAEDAAKERELAKRHRLPSKMLRKTPISARWAVQLGEEVAACLRAPRSPIDCDELFSQSYGSIRPTEPVEAYVDGVADPGSEVSGAFLLIARKRDAQGSPAYFSGRLVEAAYRLRLAHKAPPAKLAEARLAFVEWSIEAGITRAALLALKEGGDPPRGAAWEADHYYWLGRAKAEGGQSRDAIEALMRYLSLADVRIRRSERYGDAMARVAWQRMAIGRTARDPGAPARDRALLVDAIEIIRSAAGHDAMTLIGPMCLLADFDAGNGDLAKARETLTEASAILRRQVEALARAEKEPVDALVRAADEEAANAKATTAMRFLDPSRPLWRASTGRWRQFGEAYRDIGSALAAAGLEPESANAFWIAERVLETTYPAAGRGRLEIAVSRSRRMAYPDGPWLADALDRAGEGVDPGDQIVVEGRFLLARSYLKRHRYREADGYARLAGQAARAAFEATGASDNGETLRTLYKPVFELQVRAHWAMSDYIARTRERWRAASAATSAKCGALPPFVAPYPGSIVLACSSKPGPITPYRMHGINYTPPIDANKAADHGGVVLASQASIAEVAAWYKDRAVADGLNTEMSIGGDVAVILRRDGTLRQLFVTVDIDDTGDTRIVLNWHREVDN